MSCDHFVGRGLILTHIQFSVFDREITNRIMAGVITSQNLFLYQCKYTFSEHVLW